MRRTLPAAGNSHVEDSNVRILICFEHRCHLEDGGVVEEHVDTPNFCGGLQAAHLCSTTRLCQQCAARPPSAWVPIASRCCAMPTAGHPRALCRVDDARQFLNGSEPPTLPATLAQLDTRT